ncbi:hypothetical protein [Secundilactobacillus similis]|uniref:hypothetical protein n=1 Tax=Secundilactobacillus similis TaxID=414682 RepID=UPI0006D1BFE8|nr:hypothetical protein [Secundilactobacillus similis]
MVEKDESINYQFTKAGHDLAIRALAGVTQLDFTRAVTSTDNHFADTEADTLAITELANIKQTIDLKEVDAVDDDPSFVKVPVVINKAEMEEDYALLTIGLYCKPKDGDEVLYSVCAMQDPIYMHKSSNNSTYSIDLNTLVGSAANVVIKVDPAGMVTNATFDAFKVTMGQQYALKSDLDAYLKSLPANVALTDKANVFTEQQVLSAGAVNGAGAPALFKGDVDVPSDVVRADMLKPNLIDVATDEWLLANATRDDYTFTAVKGQTYNIGVAAQIGTDGEVFALQLRVPSDTDSSHLDLVATKVSGSAQQLYKSWTATVDGVIRLRPAYNVPSGSGLTGADVLFRYVVVTNSTTQVSYPTAQYNRHATQSIRNRTS